jgi:nucleoside-diphosphate-sugar epimerase
MVRVLRNARYDVVGLDSDLYQGCDFGRVHEQIPAYNLDLREIEFTDLLSFDAVIHLAALPEETLADRQAGAEYGSDQARGMAVASTLRLAECCKRASVSRFLFASSCTVYGRDGKSCGPVFDEQCPASPVTAYAASKLRCEQGLTELADGSFCPVILRNASVYGVSPRLRTDLVVNDFVASAVVNGQVVLSSDGSAWRPLVHVEDVARAYAAVLGASDQTIRGQIFNVARTQGNHRLIDIADAVTELVPQCTRRTTRAVFDEISYRVDGDKLARTFPELSFRWTIPIGIRQLRDAMVGSGLTPGDLRSDRYRRALRLKTLVERGDALASQPAGATQCRREPALI